jgi:hypothetical protein
MASVLQRHRVKLKLRWWLVPLAVITMIAQAPQNYLRNNSFVNWESAQVHPLDMTPDGTKLLAVNTANASLEVFNISDPNSAPTLLKSIPVGVDPVSVRARTNTEAWVVNVISDSVSVVDLTHGVVTKTLQADDEPADVIFAGAGNSFAFVSCAQAKTLLEFSATSPSTPLSRIPINGEQPRALAVSSNGRYVYLAIFESGNGTTIVPGGVSNGEEPSIVDDPRGPYAGANPPPNSGKNFSPAINPSGGTPPPVSLIVKRTVINGATKWIDDNNGDWSPFITGSFAANGTANAHAPGWNLPDRDVAIVDTQNNNSVSYQSGLGNILMALAVNPASGVVSVVGTDATNQIRFEPNLQSTFVRVQMAQFTPGGSSTIKDLNPHLTYQLRSIPMTQRLLSIGDPRGIVWNAAGTLAYVTGMGSNNVIVTNPSGARIGLVNVGQGPTGIVLQESDGRAFVLNKFDATISAFNLSTLSQTSVTPLLYDPTTPEIKAGRPLLYNTQQTSGLGQASCASCHVDARWDRLAWDLGDPQNTPVTNTQGITFAPMKGPLLTMTLVDSMQAPFFHWRGDRPSLNNFEDAFQTLMGADSPISDAQTTLLEHFLSEVSLVPNPYRNLDDSFSTVVSMPGPNNGVYVNGNAVLGAQEFEANCRSCHVGQTGRGAAFITTNIPFGAGARNPPTWKNFYKRIGLWFTDPTASNSGFGTQQDGTFDSSQNQTRDANMYAFMMSFNGGFPYEPAGLNATNWSNFTSASVGKQVTLTPSNPTDTTGLLAQLETLAANGQVGLIAKGTLPGNPTRGYFFLGNDHWQSDKIAEVDTTETIMTAIADGWDFTFTSVPAESAVRMGIDMDGDGILDGDDAEPAVPNANVTNLALQGIATASSEWDALHGPAAAIDGSTNGYFDQNMLFHSAGGNDDWWQVDLGQMSQISLIQIFNRVDCCSTRLSNVTIFVSPNPFTSTSLTATQAQPGVQQFFLSGYAGLVPQVPMNVQGRYVRIQLNVTQYLQLAEVRVMGYPVATFNNPGTQTTPINSSVSLPLTFNNPANNIYTFSATGLPPGLAIDPTSGIISGIPTGTASASYNVTVTAKGPGNPTVTFTWKISVTQLPQTITFGSISTQTVGTPLTLTATASSGLPITYVSAAPTVCTVSGSIATFLNAGNCGIVATQPGNATYAAAVAIGQQFSVNAKPVQASQTITFPAIGTQTAGTSISLLGTTSSGLAVSYASSTLSVCTISASTAMLLASGNCTITASQAGNSSYSAATPVSQTFLVNGAATSTATLVSLAGYNNVNAIDNAGTAPIKGGIDSWQNVAYNSASLGTAVTYNGFIFPLGPANALDAMYGGPVALPAGNFTNLYVIGTGVDGAWPNQSIVVTYTDGTTSTFSQSMSNWIAPSNYADETIVVSAANQLVASSAVSGSTATASSVVVTTPTYLYGYTFPLTAGKTAASVQFPVNSNIVILGIAMFSVPPASQTISFGAIAAQPAGSTVPLTATASSGLPVSYASLTSSVCKISGSTAILSAAGTCTITAQQVGNSSYQAAAPVTQSFAVNVASQTITFNSITTQVVGTPLTLLATASSGLPVSYATSTSTVCTVSGSTATFVSAGTCTITASQGGNTSFIAAAPVSQSFSVSAKPLTPQTITFAPIALQIAGTPLTLTATASSGLPVSYASSTTFVCTVTGSTATLLAAGTCTITASQVGNTSYAAATPVSQSFTVNAGSADGATIVGLASYYNIDAIATVGTAPKKGGIDSWQNIAYNSATLGTSVTYNGIVFPLGPSNSPDAMFGGPVTLPAGSFSKLYVIGTGVDGAWPTQTITVTYTDGTKSTFTQSMSNWTAPSSYSGETTVVSAANQLNSTGAVVATPSYLYGYTFSLIAGKIAKSVSFPVNSNIVILGAALQ